MSFFFFRIKKKNFLFFQFDSQIKANSNSFSRLYLSKFITKTLVRHMCGYLYHKKLVFVVYNFHMLICFFCSNEMRQYVHKILRLSLHLECRINLLQIYHFQNQYSVRLLIPFSYPEFQQNFSSRTSISVEL